MGGRLAIGRRLAVPLLALLSLVPAGLTGCNDNSSGDTIVVNGLDCGLIRDHLFGTWTVSYTPALRTLVKCDVSTYDLITQVDTVGGTVTYTSDNVFAPEGTVGFTMEGRGPLNLPREIIASIDADSCLALVQTWEDDDGGYLQCFGTADLSAHLLNVICDSFDLNTVADGMVACSLNGSITGTVGLP